MQNEPGPAAASEQALPSRQGCCEAGQSDDPEGFSCFLASSTAGSSPIPPAPDLWLSGGSQLVWGVWTGVDKDRDGWSRHRGDLPAALALQTELSEMPPPPRRGISSQSSVLTRGPAAGTEPRVCPSPGASSDTERGRLQPVPAVPPMATYGHSWPPMATYGHLLLSIAIYCPLLTPMATYGHLRPPRVTYCHLLPSIATYRHPSPLPAPPRGSARGRTAAEGKGEFPPGTGESSLLPTRCSAFLRKQRMFEISVSDHADLKPCGV